MGTDETPKWSTEEKQLLQHESFVSEILKRRAPSGNNEQKPLWQRFLETTGGAAVITVLIGGIFGQIISSSIQSSLKEREFQQAWLKERGDQALVANKEYLEKEQETMLRAYELIGACISASEDLISLTGSDFRESNYTGAKLEDVKKTRAKLLENYNSKDYEWRSSRERFKLLIGYYHSGHPTVVDAWNSSQEAITRYMTCAQKWFNEHPDNIVERDIIPSACKDEKNNMSELLKGLNTSLEKARRYAWEGWESPETLKSVLKKENDDTPNKSFNQTP